MIAVVDFNQDTRKPYVAEGRVFVDGEILGVAQARVSNVGIRQGSASCSGRASWLSTRFIVFGSLEVVLRCHERHEGDSL